MIFMNQTFQREELTLQDFLGGAFIGDFGGGVFVAKNYTAMHVGIPKPLMLASYMNPVFLSLAMNAAKAIILMKGVSEGLIDGVGLTSSVGSLEYKGTYQG
ncbi:hypothetical protein BG57_09865 [Caballeronia grimmiae]|uniref:Uncharacterized protein n=1 Tax=Caballeronia grimmiae TaxID=1071679 RepID=A0A069P923_9BURK|nr:hypothetical protein BG57_09865 [Caballeronia grimmiae]